MCAAPRILLLFGTRPEAIKTASVIAALRRHAALTVRVAVTDQHRALLDQALAASELVPDVDLNLMRAGQPHRAMLGALIDSVAALLEAERPARLLAREPRVTVLPPLDYPAMVRLLGLSHLLLTDSGGLQEEAPALDVPVLVLRDTTERPEGIAAGCARLVGTAPARIVAAATRLLDDSTAHAAMARARNPYGDGRAGERIAAILARLHGDDAGD